MPDPEFVICWRDMRGEMLAHIEQAIRDDGRVMLQRDGKAKLQLLRQEAADGLHLLRAPLELVHRITLFGNALVIDVMLARMDGFLREKLFHFRPKFRIVNPVPECPHRITEEGFACRKKCRERVEIGGNGRVAVIPVLLLSGFEMTVARSEGDFTAAQARCFAAGGGHRPSFRFSSYTVFQCATVLG